MWEFEVVSMSDEAMFKDKLNELGATGWELVHASSHYVRYDPPQPGMGHMGYSGGGGGSRPPKSGYTQWNAALKRKLVTPVGCSPTTNYPLTKS